MTRIPHLDDRVKLLRTNDVLGITGWSTMTLWRRVKSGAFPRPVRPGGPHSKAVAWLRDDVERYLTDLARDREPIVA